MFICNPLPICFLLEQHGRKNKETDEVVTNEEGRREGQRKRMRKSETDGNQAVGEFCLDTARR
ncbi:hypothetical protein PTA92_23510, partial [Shigella sonnei]|nr:hypothetical protein [Shigella sonnei]